MPGFLRRIRPAVPPRELAAADRTVAEELQSIDVLLADWVDLPKNWVVIDALLDERLMLRPADVMASRRVPVVPGRSA